MADKINSVMATEIGLSVAPTQRALSALRKSVDVTRKAVLNNAQAIKDSGDAWGASKLKAEEFDAVIEKQRAVVSRLGDDMQRAAETAKNREATMKDLQEQISKLTGERTRARNELREVAREQGKTSEAYTTASNKVKDLTETLKQLQAQYRYADKSDVTATRLAKSYENARYKLLQYQNEQRQAIKEQNELKPTGWNRVVQAITHANQKMQETRKESTGLKGVMSGTFFGNAISNAASNTWGAVKNAIGGAVATGWKFNSQQQAMTANWETLAGSASKGKEMVDMTNEMAVSAQNSTEMVDKLNQKFFAVTNSVGKTRELSNSVLKLQDAFNVSDDALGNFATQWSQMVGNGKASAQDMLSIQNVFPKFRGELLKYEQQVTHNKNLTMQQMNDMMSKGKISSDAMNHVLISMGEEYKNSTQNFAKTLPGMTRTIKAMMPRLIGEATKPLTQAASPLYRAVSNWVSDPKTDAKFKQLGQKAQQSMAQVIKAFGGSSQVNVTNGLNRAIDGIGNTIQRAAGFIAQHANTIKASFNLIKAVGNVAFKVLASAVRSALTVLSIFTGQTNRSRSGSQSTAQAIQGLANALNALTKHRTAIQMLGRALLGIFVAKKVLGVVSAVRRFHLLIGGPLISGVTRAIGVISKFGGVARVAGLALRAIPVVGVTLAIAGLVTWFVKLYTHSKKFRDFCAGIVTIAKNVLMSVLKFTPFGRMAISLTNLYKHNPKFRAFCRGLAKSAKTIAGAAIDHIRNRIKWLVDGFKKAYDFIADIGASKSIKHPSNRYSSGTSGTTEDQVAIVNDSNDRHWREMMLYKDRLYAFPQRRNLKAYIPKGAEVISGDASDKLAKQRGLAHFASGSSELSSWINGLNANGRGERGEVIKAFMQKLNKQFSKQLKKFEEQIAKAQATAQTSISKANQSFRERMAKARQSMQQRIAKANQSMQQRMAKAQQSMQEKLTKAHQRLVERLTKIAQSSAERKQKAVQSRNERIAKAKATEQDKLQKAGESANAKVDKANATWANQQKKYKDKPKLLEKARKRHQERLAKIDSMMQDQIARAMNASQASQGKAWDSYQKSITSINSSVGKQTKTAQTSLAKSNQFARDSFAKSTQSARDSFAKSTQSAHNSFNNTSAKATQAVKQAIAKARQTEAHKVDLANLNIARLKAWKQDNINQLNAGYAEYSHGGIATTPSIFGEAGAEAAVPLDQMKQGDAWQTLEKVVSFYSGNSSNTSTNSPVGSSTSDQEVANEIKQGFAQLFEYLGTLVDVGNSQVRATKGIQGYDSRKAFDDFSSNFSQAVAGNLTY